jgi:hypothetical protein
MHAAKMNWKKSGGEFFRRSGNRPTSGNCARPRAAADKESQKYSQAAQQRQRAGFRHRLNHHLGGAGVNDQIQKAALRQRIAIVDGEGSAIAIGVAVKDVETS